MKSDQMAGTLLISHRFNVHSVASNTRIDSPWTTARSMVMAFRVPTPALPVRQFAVLDETYGPELEPTMCCSLHTGPLSHKPLFASTTRIQPGSPGRLFLPGLHVAPCFSSPPPLDVYARLRAMLMDHHAPDAQHARHLPAGPDK
jgi:hypothetical protein